MALSLGFLVSVALGAWYVAHRNRHDHSLQVMGPSMSPTLWGPSRFVQCGHCQFQWRLHAENWSDLGLNQVTSPLRCFRCGERQVRAIGNPLPGDQVHVDWDAFAEAMPDRNELVAIRKEDHSYEVKRVVGLPGETLRIDAQGQVLINDQPWNMSLTDWWDRRVLVYDDPCHQEGQQAESTRQHSSRFREPIPGQWIYYEHHDIYKQGATAPVGDDNPANASERRQLHPVHHFWLELQVSMASPGRLEVAFLDRDPSQAGHGNFAQNHPDRSASQWVTGAVPLPMGQHRLRFANDAGRVWLLDAIAGMGEIQMGNEADFGSRPSPIAAPWPSLSDKQPVAYRFRNATDYRIEARRVWRRERFDPPVATLDVWLRGITIPAEHFMVLGDNPSRSHDSRHDPAGIPRQRIRGRVTLAKLSLYESPNYGAHDGAR